jgi:outer membrane phospholipase A
MFREQFEKRKSCKLAHKGSLMSLNHKLNVSQLSSYSNHLHISLSYKHSVTSNKKQKMEVKYENSSCLC